MTVAHACSRLMTLSADNVMPFLLSVEVGVAVRMPLSADNECRAGGISVDGWENVFHPQGTTRSTCGGAF
jgi:hypothetical protein